MSDSVVESLTLDLLEWLAKRQRSYEETMDAWRRSCPKLPVWEDANDRGLIALDAAKGHNIVRLTPTGLAFLERKDGSRVAVLLGGALFEGSRTEGVAFVLDLSEQKRAEKALRRSEAFLAEGQHLSQIGSFSWRVATDEITWSEQLYRIYEFEIGAPVTLELIRTHVHPEDLTLLEKMVDRCRFEAIREPLSWRRGSKLICGENRPVTWRIVGKQEVCAEQRVVQEG